MDRRIIVVAVVAAVLLLFAFYLSMPAAPNAKMRIGHVPLATANYFYIALDKGFFNETGLDAEAVPFSDSNAMFNALASGSIDAIGGGASAVAYGIETRAPGTIRIVGLIDNTNLPAIIVSKQSNITTLQELNHKRIGTFPGGGAVSTLNAVLESEHVQPSEVIQLTPALHLEALAKGSVDAILSYEPTTSILLGKGVARILLPKAGSFIAQPLYLGFAGVSQRFFTKNPGATVRFADAMTRARNYFKQNEQEARLIMMRYAQLDRTTALSIPSLPYVDFKETTAADIAAAQKLADFYYEKNVTTGKVNVTQMMLAIT